MTALSDGVITDMLWVDALAATRRLDRVPMRAIVSRDLGPGAVAAWDELADAVTSDEAEESTEHWTARSEAIIDRLLEQAGTDGAPDARSVLALEFVYYECVVLWEYSANYRPLEMLLGSAARRARAMTSAATSGAVVALLHAVALACDSLLLQLDVERGWSCGCPVATGDASTAAVTTLRLGTAAIDAAGVEIASLGDGHDELWGLHGIVDETLHDALGYFGLLAEHVAPAALRFVENLYERRDDAEVRALLRRALDATSRALSGERTRRIVGVFRTEARAQARAVAGMLAVVADADPAPTLLVDSAELQFVFPFRLPAGADDVQVHRLLVQHLDPPAGSGDSAPAGRLADCAVTVEQLLQTESLTRATDVIEPDAANESSTRLVLAERQLVLETTGGERYCGFGVEVVLGAMGNHVVRVTASTDMVVMDRDGDRWQPRPEGTGWSPHDLDQFLHRGGQDFGDEAVGFLTTAEVRSGAPIDTEPDGDSPAFTSIIDLVATIIEDLHAPLHDLMSKDELRLLSADIERRVRQQGHILVSIADACAVLDGARRPIDSTSELLRVAGAGLLFSNQPPLPRALEEWTCAPAITELPDGLLGTMDSFMVCNGDTTLLFGPFSPNWQVIEDKELVLFALSLGSAYIGSRASLLDAMNDAAELDTPEDLTLQNRDQIEEFASEVHRVESNLNRWTAFADRLIDHARGAVVIRPRRDRALLDHVIERSGVISFHDDLTATRQTANDRVADLREVSGKVRDARRRRGEVLVERLLLAVAVLAFVDLFWWYFDTHRDPIESGWTIYFWVVTGLMILAFVALASMVLRRSNRRVRHSKVPDIRTDRP